MTFKELLEKLERRLGYHQIPVNGTARGIKEIFDGSPLHPEFMTKLVRAIYAGNGCRTLTDPVTRTATFNALAPLRLELLRASSTDVDARRLLDELCVALDRAFSSSAEKIPAPAATAQPRESAEVIELEPFRRGRRFRTSA